MNFETILATATGWLAREIVIPAVKRVVYRRLTKYSKEIYSVLDEVYPMLLADPKTTPGDLVDIFVARLQTRLGSRALGWVPTATELAKIFKDYDPRAALAKPRG